MVGYLEIEVSIKKTIRVPVDDLSCYEAETLEEAAKNQKKWFSDGTFSVVEFLELCAETHDGAETMSVQDVEIHPILLEADATE